jgi:uncharacterized phage-associated protein
MPPKKIPTLSKKDQMIRTVRKFRDLEEERQKKETIAEENGIVELKEKETKKIVEEEKKKGFKNGNKPKALRNVYSWIREKENIPKQELRSNEAVIFIKHNANIGKWWHDPKTKKNYKQINTELTKYILDNREKTVIQIMKFKEEALVKKAMDSIRRVMTQIGGRGSGIPNPVFGSERV